MAESQEMKHGIMAALAAALAVTLAACGGSTSTTTVSSVAETSASSTPGSSGGSAVSPASNASTPTTAPAPTGPPACVASMLTLSYLGGQGATGHGELGFELRNTGTTTCRTFGFPGIQFLSKSGRPVTTATTRTTHDFFGVAPEGKILVAPGRGVSFRLGVTHGAASPASCTTAYGLQVIPPDDSVALRTSIPNGGAYECGTVTVSPVRPGTSAFP